MTSRLQQFSQINVTPLTDVFLVLLVVMLVVSPAVSRNVFKIDPPPCGNGPVCGPPPYKGAKIHVRVPANGQISVNGEVVRPATGLFIQEALEKARLNINASSRNPHDDIPLVVEADSDALQRDVVAVMDAAAGVGLRQMSILPLSNSAK